MTHVIEAGDFIKCSVLIYTEKIILLFHMEGYERPLH
jgi:hypothetical protein